MRWLHAAGCFALGAAAGVGWTVSRHDPARGTAATDDVPAEQATEHERNDSIHRVEALWSADGAESLDRGRLADGLEQCRPDEIAPLARRTATSATASSAALDMIFCAWAEQDPEAAVEFARQLPAGSPRRHRALIAALFGWARENAEGASEWLVALPDTSERTRMAGELARRLTETRPAEAVMIAREGGAGFSVLQNAFASWTAVDADAAEEFLESFPAGLARDRLLNHGAVRLSETSVERALEWAEKISGRERQNDALHKIARIWTERDPQAAVAWVNSQTDESVRATLQLGCAEALSERDPALAASILTRVGSVDEARRVAGEVAANWFQRDAEAAKQWAPGLPWKSARASAVIAVAQTWAKTSPDDALAWLQRTAQSAAERDEYLFWASLNGDPAVGIRWAAVIEDPGRRDQALEIIVEHWVRNDPQSALKGVENSSLSPETKRGLRARYDR